VVNAIAGNNPQTPSLYEQAADYFKEAPKQKQKLAELQAQLSDATVAKNTKSGKDALALEHKIQFLQSQYDQALLTQQQLSLVRLNSAIDVCLQILKLSEGKNYEITQQLSAKFLTTLVLFSPEKGRRLAELHQKLKPAYKAVLSLRVLDKLINDSVVKNSYILKNFDAEKRYTDEPTNSECFTQAVILPIMLAAIFQDVGLKHPQLELLLTGEEGELDRFRLLEKEQREEMLSLNYQHTVDYLTNGLGLQQSDAETKEQVVEFEQVEQKRLKFQLGLVLDANSSKLGTSEIIKIPQIYASVIFSTKRDFKRSSLPTASILIAQLAIKKVISSEISKVFIDIVGQFPLGYGITYIPRDLNGEELELYEYAIVSRLNPKNIDEPVCRLVTKNLIFLPHGKTAVIAKERNLHFPEARKKLIKIDPKRLAEILQKLSHNYQAGDYKSTIPYLWEPHIYFCVEGNQNLWSASK
jgi:hypothetical protein